MNKRENTGKKAARMQTSAFLRCLSAVFIVAQVVVALIMGMKLFKMNIVPTPALLIFAAVIIGFNVATVFISKKLPGFIITTVISILVTAVLAYALTAVIKSDKALSKVTGYTGTEIVNMSIFVRSEDPIAAVSDLKNETVGYVSEEKSAEDVIRSIDEVTGNGVDYITGENILNVIDSLLNKECKAIIINSAYLDVVSEQVGYEDLSDRIRELNVYTVEVETPVEEKVEPQIEYLYNLDSDEDRFVVYISGIDMWGWVNARSRSDVNILAVINGKTNHIQLINTPRDYYVYLPIQDGMDKLTHAGLYGIDSSKAALENLYGIKIDYYLKMNFSGFERIVDSLGGIDVYSQYDFTVEPIKHYTVGYNHVTGLEALAFARERYALPGGDVTRGANQMEVIKAVFNKMTSPAILTNYDEVLDNLDGFIMTDMPQEVIYDLVRYQLTTGKSWTIDSISVTGRGESSTTYSIPDAECYVMIPNEEEVKKAMDLMDSVLSEE